jgi:acetyl-CoA carboxylase carboxyl transferase subunit beta
MIQNIFHRHRQAGALWVQCTRCHELIYQREFDDNLKTCPRCNHHARISAAERVANLIDAGTWSEEDGGLQPADPLSFISLGEEYASKLVESQQKTGLNEAAIAGSGALDDFPVRLVVLDFAFMGGSMASVVGEKVARAAERSCADRRPLVLVSASGGARMQEGIYSLMQMAKTSAALARLGSARVPSISVLTDPTTGGVTASFATLADVIFAESGALIGFAGPRVIEQTTKQKLPPDAQRPEFLLKHGMIDGIVHRRDLKAALARTLRLFAAGPYARTAPTGQAARTATYPGTLSSVPGGASAR